jgi:hypothetical protein
MGWVDVACILALLGFAVLLCAPILGGRVPVATDTLALWGPVSATAHEPIHNPALADSALQYLPAQVFVRRSLAGGEWPLWNPDLFSGYPFLADDENQLYYPVAWLLLLLPLGLAIQASTLFHIWLAGAGMYVLGRVLGVSRPGSLIAGLAFAGSGQLYTALEITGVADIYCWLPWIVAAAEIAWQRRSWRWAAIAGLLSGVMGVAGHLPWYLFGETFLALWLAGHIVVEATSRMRNAEISGSERSAFTYSTFRIRNTPHSPLWGQTARAAAILVWGPALAAVHFLPFLQMATLSSRLQAAGFAVPAGGLQSVLGLLGAQLTIFVPQLLGTSVGQVGTPLTFNSCWYIGLGPLALACVALLLRRDRRVLLLGIVGALAFAIGADLPLFNELSRLPGLQTQIPGRIGYLFIFCMSLLAGFGFDAALEFARNRPRRWVVTGALLLCAGLGVAYLVLEKHSASALQPALYALQSAALGQAGLVALALLLWVLAVAALLSRASRNGSGRWRAGKGDAWGRAIVVTFMIVLVGVDLLTYAPNYNTYVAPDALFPHAGAAAYLKSEPGLWRLIAPDVPAVNFPPNSSTLYGLHDVQGYDSLHFKRYDDFWAAADNSTIDNASNYFNVQLRPQSFLSPQARLLNAEFVTTYLALNQAGQTHRSFDLGELSTEPIAQRFTAPGPLTSLEFSFDTNGRVNHAPVILHVRRTLTDTVDLVTQVVDPSGWKGRPWIKFTFPALRVKAGDQLTAILQTPANSPGDSVSVLGTKGLFHQVGQLYQGGKWRTRSMAFIAEAALPPSLKLAYRGEVSVYTDTAALPRAFVVGFAQVVSTTSVLARMARKSFDPSSALLIEQAPPPGFDTQPGDAAPAGSATITGYHNLSVDATANMARPGWLVLGDLNYPGWHVQVDGKEAPLYTADYVVRAVPLSAGVHSVHFYFLPTPVVAGGIISAVALLLAVIAMVGPRGRRRET